MLKRLKQGLNNLFGKLGIERRQQRVIDRDTAKNLKRLEEDLKKGRGYADARADREEKKRKELEEQVESGRSQEIPEYLQEKKQEMIDDDWVGALSIRGLVHMIENPDHPPISVISYGEEEEFGKLEDVWVSKEGVIGLVDENGNRIAAGSDLGKLAASPGGLKNQVMNGYWRTPVNEDRQPIAPPEGAKVPAMIEIDGEIVSLKNTRRKYKKQVGEYRQQLQRKQSRIEELETTLEQVVQEHKDESLRRKIAEESLQIETTNSEKQVQEAMNAKQQFSRLQDQLSRTTSESQMKEQLVKDMWAEKDKWSDLYTDQFDDDELDVAMDKVHRIASMVVNNFDELSDMQEQQVQTVEASSGGSSNDQSASPRT